MDSDGVEQTRGAVVMIADHNQLGSHSDGKSQFGLNSDGQSQFNSVLIRTDIINLVHI